MLAVCVKGMVNRHNTLFKDGYIREARFSLHGIKFAIKHFNCVPYQTFCRQSLAGATCRCQACFQITPGCRVSVTDANELVTVPSLASGQLRTAKRWMQIIHNV